MKASELIEKLQYLQQKGNNPDVVVIASNSFFNGTVLNVEFYLENKEGKVTPFIFIVSEAK